MALGGIFGKMFGGGKTSINELFPNMEMQGSARVLKAIDPTGAQISRRVSNLAEMEVWLHGKGVKSATNRVDKWVGAISQTETRPIQDIVNSVIKENEVSSVLLSACNIERQIVNTPGNTQAIYGLGLGYHNKYESGMMSKSKLGGAFAWEHAVVVAEGESAKIYTRGEILKQLQGRGILPEVVEDRSVVGIFKDVQGRTRIGANVLASTEQDVLAASLPIEEVPHIQARIPNKGEASFEFGGKKFSTFEEAYKMAARDAPSVKVVPKANGAVVNKSVVESGGAKIVNRSPKNAVTAEVVEQVARGTFKPAYIKVAGLAAAVAAGGLFLTSLLGHKNDTRQNQSTNDNTPQTTIDRGQREETLKSTTITRKPENSPKASTKVRLTDADLNMSEVDSAFAHYFKQGFAYSS